MSDLADKGILTDEFGEKVLEVASQIIEQINAA